MDIRIELLAVPVADIDAAKAFYVEKLGFVADHDHVVSSEIRFVQLTPPGSACSIVLDLNFTPMLPGAVQGIQCVIDDADEALAALTAAGVEAGPVQDLPWGRFVSFTDLDGNGWSYQAIVSPSS